MIFNSEDLGRHFTLRLTPQGWHCFQINKSKHTVHLFLQLTLLKENECETIKKLTHSVSAEVSSLREAIRMLSSNVDGKGSSECIDGTKNTKGQKEYNSALDNIKQLLIMTQDMAQAHFDVRFLSLFI